MDEGGEVRIDGQLAVGEKPGSETRVVPGDLGDRDARVHAEHRHDESRAGALRAGHEDGTFRECHGHELDLLGRFDPVAPGA